MSTEALSRVTSGVPGMPASGLPPEFGPVLLKLSAGSSSHFGCAGAHLEPVEYRERPFSHLLRAAVFANGRPGPVTHVFVKIFKVKAHEPDPERMRRRVVQEFESTLEVHRAMSADPDVGAVRPIACYPEHLASVTEEVPGRTLLDCLRAEAAWLPQQRTLERLSLIMEKAGRWVRTFQAIDLQPGRVSLDAVRSYVDLRLERLVASPAARFAPADRARVLAHIQRLGALVPPLDLAEARIHADLAPANMLVSGERIVVLDFAMCSRGSAFHDLARLFLQIDLLRLKPQVKSAVIERLNRSLLRGFDPQVGPDRPLFRLLLLQHRVNHLATLSVSQEGYPAAWYNWYVRRYHRARLEEEIACRALVHRDE